MRDSMIVKQFVGEKPQYEHNICCCRDCDVKNPIEIIPTYYSYLHALDEGWRFSHHINFKEPGSEGPAAICPDCVKKLESEGWRFG